MMEKVDVSGNKRHQTNTTQTTFQWDHVKGLDTRRQLYFTIKHSYTNIYLLNTLKIL